jgi:hypothetical protein
MPGALRAAARFERVAGQLLIASTSLPAGEVVPRRTAGLEAAELPARHGSSEGGRPHW